MRSLWDEVVHSRAFWVSYLCAGLDFGGCPSLRAGEQSLRYDPIRSLTLRFWSAWLGILVLTVASGLSPSRGQEKNEPFKELELTYEVFDQRPGGGWRKFAEEGKLLEAARLIDRYEREKKDLEEWQGVNLRFHAGQLYAFANQNDQALARFKTALRTKERAGSPISWNAYVRATIAFLERDRKKLTELREEIARGPKRQGVVPNLDVVDRLIEHFDKPYSVAYGKK